MPTAHQSLMFKIYETFLCIVAVSMIFFVCLQIRSKRIWSIKSLSLFVCLDCFLFLTCLFPLSSLLFFYLLFLTLTHDVSLIIFLRDVLWSVCPCCTIPQVKTLDLRLEKKIQILSMDERANHICTKINIM